MPSCPLGSFRVNSELHGINGNHLLTCELTCETGSHNAEAPLKTGIARPLQRPRAALAEVPGYSKELPKPGHQINNHLAGVRGRRRVNRVAIKFSGGRHGASSSESTVHPVLGAALPHCCRHRGERASHTGHCGGHRRRSCSSRHPQTAGSVLKSWRSKAAARTAPQPPGLLFESASERRRVGVRRNDGHSRLHAIHRHSAWLLRSGLVPLQLCTKQRHGLGSSCHQQMCLRLLWWMLAREPVLRAAARCRAVVQ